MHLYIARGMKGGISIVSKHYVKVNNQLVEGYKSIAQELLQRSSINPMNIFSHGYHGERYCSRAPTQPDDEGGGEAQLGGRRPYTYSSKCSLGLQRTYLILDIYVMVN